MPIVNENIQKQLGLFLFLAHINEKIQKANKGIRVTKKLNLSLPRSSLITIYESFVRPHLDYGDIIYDQPNNASLSDKIESVQYNAVLAITGAIKEISKERLYQELGLESLMDRRWLGCLYYLYKIASTKVPLYLYERTRQNPGCFKPLRCRTELFQNSFLTFTVSEWKKLDPDVRNIGTYSFFRKNL